MKSLLSSGRLVATLAVLLAVATAARAELPILTKARAYLGPEAALNAVKSVHYQGSFPAPDPADFQKQVAVRVDIIFQAPYRQRTIRSTSAFIDTTALDTYDGWHRTQDPSDPSRWRLQLLPADQIKRQRAIALENLGFYREPEHAGVKVLDQGLTTIGGVACHKVAFAHSADIIFHRYFEEATGRLVLTETESGASIREHGEIMVNGIRFPKMIFSTSKGKDGKNETVTITFDKITVNETFPDSVFAVPPFSGK